MAVRRRRDLATPEAIEGLPAEARAAGFTSAEDFEAWAERWRAQARRIGRPDPTAYLLRCRARRKLDRGGAA